MGASQGRSSGKDGAVAKMRQIAETLGCLERFGVDEQHLKDIRGGEGSKDFAEYVAGCIKTYRLEEPQDVARARSVYPMVWGPCEWLWHSKQRVLPIYTPPAICDPIPLVKDNLVSALGDILVLGIPANFVSEDLARAFHDVWPALTTDLEDEDQPVNNDLPFGWYVARLFAANAPTPNNWALATAIEGTVAMCAMIKLGRALVSDISVRTEHRHLRVINDKIKLGGDYTQAETMKLMVLRGQSKPWEV